MAPDWAGRATRRVFIVVGVGRAWSRVEVGDRSDTVGRGWCRIWRGGRGHGGLWRECRWAWGAGSRLRLLAVGAWAGRG